MRKIRDVLRYRHSAGLSLEATARALNISKGVVAKYIRLASAAGLSWPLPDELDDSGLETLLYRQVAAREPTFAEPDYALVHQELKKKGVTTQNLAIHIGQIDFRVAPAIDFNIALSDTIGHESFQDTGI